MAGLCPENLYKGECLTQGCTLRHDARLCSTCGVICTSDAVYNSHINGKLHRSNIASAAASTRVTCPICFVPVTGEANWYQHIKGAAHRKKAQNQGREPSCWPYDSDISDSVRCFVCKRAVHVHNIQTHLCSNTHRRLENVAVQRSKIEQAGRDRRGVTVSHSEKGLDFGVVSRSNAASGKHIDVSINSTTSSNILVMKAEAFASNLGGPNP